MKIICDTMSDVPKEIINQYDIEVVPLNILINDKEYLDGVDISNEEFYEILRTSEHLPKTSQITYIRFKECFEKFTTRGEDVLYIGGACAASGTFQSAVIASQDIIGLGKVYTFDTNSLSVCAGAFVVKAALLKEQQLPIEEILNELNASKTTESAFFFVDELEFLQKGGRISSTKATIGKLLNVKPILTIKNGIVHQESQVRGKKNITSTLINYTKKIATDLNDRIVILGYCDNKTDVEKLRDELLKECIPKKLYLVNIGACISSHSGPSIVGIATL